MGYDGGAAYKPNDEELRLLEEIIAKYSGQSSSVVRPAIVTAWTLQFDEAPGASQHDWFDYLAAEVPKLPNEAEQLSRSAFMAHASRAGHTTRPVNVQQDWITVVCVVCGLLSGPYTSTQSLPKNTDGLPLH